MSAGAGRNLKLKDATATVLAGIRTKGIKIGNEPIDITTDDETGIRTFLETAGGELEVASRQIDISFEGISKDDVLLKAATENSGLIATYTLEFPSGATIVGSFAFISYEETGEYQTAVTFSGELQSTGAWVWTDAP